MAPSRSYKWTALYAAIAAVMACQSSLHALEQVLSLSPRNFTATSLNSTAISLTWLPPAANKTHGVIRLYDIAYLGVDCPSKSIITTQFIENSTNAISMMPDGNATNVIVGNLSEWSCYAFIIRAKTVNFGPFSEAVFVRTNETAPSSAPRKFTATPLNSTAASLTWLPPAANKTHDVIRLYDIAYLGVDCQSKSIITAHFIENSTNAISMMADGNATNVIVDNLSKWSCYAFIIRAQTVDFGPFSEAVIVRTNETAPSSAPRNFITTPLNSTATSLNWLPPAANKTHGVIRLYDIAYLRVDCQSNSSVPIQFIENSTDAIRMVSHGNATNVIVGNLSKWNCYAFIIRAKTVDFGPFSEAVIVRTNETVPSSAPLGLTAVPINSTAMRLEWTLLDPNSANGIVRHYQIWYINVKCRLSNDQVSQLEPNSTEISLISVEGTLSVIEIGNLSKWSCYAFKVRAKTVAFGPYGSMTSNRTKEDAPSATPEIVSVQPLNSTSMMVVWTPINQTLANGIIRQYDVQFLKINCSFDEDKLKQAFQDSSAKQTQSTFGNMSKIELKGLSKWSCYGFAVRAKTVAYGRFSDIIANRTMEDAPSKPAVILAVKNASSTSLLVEWQPPPPGFQNGQLRKYEIVYRKLSCPMFVSFDEVEPTKPSPATEEPTRPTTTPMPVQNITNVNGSTTSVLLENLDVWSCYHIQVVAWTIRRGIASDSQTGRTSEGVPTMVRSLRFINATSKSVTIAWERPKIMNGILRHFKISRCLVDQGGSLLSCQNNTVGADVNIHSISNLNPFTNYSIAVAAATSSGEGQRLSIIARTAEGIPSKPLNLTGYPSPTAVNLTWKTPEHANGIVYYHVTYYECENPSDQTEMPVPGPMATTLNIVALHEYVCYIFTLRPFTKGGGNGTTDSISVTTHPTAPTGPPVGLKAVALSSTNINITWHAPSPYERNGPIDNYMVSINGSDFSTTGNETFFYATSLQKYMLYVITVRANNSYGLGPSDSLTGKTLQDVPGPVSNLACRNSSSTSLTVTWKEPTSSNGIITGYFISSHEIRKLSQKNESLGSATNRYEAKELEKFTLYEMKVFAKTSIGYGISQTVNCSTAEDVPGKVMNLSVTSGPFWLYLQWEPPTVFNGVLLGYKIIVTSDEKQELVFTQKEEKLNVTSLSAYTSYTVSVTARTGQGDGPPAVLKPHTLQWFPSKVRHLRQEGVITATSVSVHWDIPIPANGDVRYHVFARSASQLPVDDVLKAKTAELSVVIENLEEHTTHTITVEASTDVGAGPNSSIEITTGEAAPTGKPQNLKAAHVTSTKVDLEWNPPPIKDQNGHIDFYELSCNCSKSQSTTSGNSTSFTFNTLEEFVVYQFTVKAHNSKGLGPAAHVVVTTLEDRPGKPRWKNFENITSTEVRIEWTAPAEEDLNGHIVNYRLNVTLKSSSTLVDTNIVDSKTFIARVQNLESYQKYVASLEAATSIGWGDAIYEEILTNVDAPAGPPLQVKVTLLTSRSISLSWNPPLQPNGPIVDYLVRYYHNNGNVKEQPSASTAYMIDGLLPFTRYTISVACRSLGGIGEFSPVISMTTKVEPPPQPSPSPQPTIPPGHSEYVIQLWRASDTNGIISNYWVVVVEAKKDSNGKPIKPSKQPKMYLFDSLLTYAEAQKQKQETGTPYPYIAANVIRANFPKDGLFVVGDGNNYPTTNARARRSLSGSYFNGPLDPQSTYFVFQRAFVDEKNYVSSSDWIEIKTGAKPEEPSGSGGIIAAVIVCLLLLAMAAVIAVYFVRRRRQEKDEDIDSHEMPELNKSGVLNEGCDDQMLISRQPVRRDQFANRVFLLNKDGKLQFSEEFKLIRNEPSATAEHSLHPINREKNRYNNIVAYDQTRLCLVPRIDILESDYINANFIEGYGHDRAYIATQGPLENTCEDFWRMVWEHNVPSIVMVTRIEENGKRKCYPYWPDVGSAHFGCMQITLTDSLALPGWRLNTFSILNDNEPDKEKFVKHFHYLKWPDHGVPSQPQELLAFIRKINNSTPVNSGPTLVHCSAGVGRTGTYIVLDVCLKRLAAEGTIDIFNFLQKIRSQRNYMVQTEAQYIFIHNAILDHISCGVTEVQARNLREYAKKLQQVSPNATQFGIDVEFQKLNNSAGSSPQSYAAANLQSNKEKNRFFNILPFDSTRVHLRMLPGVAGSDYINANMIDGYAREKAFIAAQAPLPTTIVDFWRMIWEQQCSTIVCLAKETESEKVIKVHRYWPSIEAAIYGPLMIESMQEKLHPDFIVRQLKVTHVKENTSRVVCQFQFTSWPDNVIPESGSAMVDFIGHVLKWQAQAGDQVVTVHCSAGVGRTGVFIALSNLIERVKCEGVVDVFQTVRTLRSQRPAMVQTKGQYLFCYLAMLDYLASFDIYANFL